MPLTRAKKTEKVAALAHELEHSTSAIIGTFSALTASKDYDLRKNRFCRDRGISMLRVSYEEQERIERWITDYVRDLGAARVPIFRFSSPLLYVNPFGDEPGGCAVC